MRLTRTVSSPAGQDGHTAPRSREQDRSAARERRAAVPIEFVATVIGGQPATVDRDGFTGYLFGMAARPDGRVGSLVVQRADDPVPEWQPYCLIWGRQEGTTYGGVCRAEVADGEVVFELLRHNAAELGIPTVFRIVFPPRHTEEVRAGLRRTLGDAVVS